MVDAIYGCDTCRTTIGRAGCPTHRDKPSPGVNFYITTCIHGLDLRLVPRCYLCKPIAIEAEARAAVLRELRDEVEGMPDQWGPSDQDGYIRQSAVLAAIDRRLNNDPTLLEEEGNICPICHNIIIKEAHGGLHPSPGDHDSGLHVIDTYGEK